MTPLVAIVLAGAGMVVVSLVGVVTLSLPRHRFDALVLPLVALAAGSLLGGALFHMLPTAIDRLGNDRSTYGLLALGALTFLVLEQFLHWHHCHKSLTEHDMPCAGGAGGGQGRRPVGHLVLLADGLHNLLGGLAVGGVFVLDVRLGFVAWIVAVAHEVPQELGDFGLLVHSGWSKGKALAFNVLSASTFLIGGLLAWAVSGGLDVTGLVPFAAGNFLYIAMADLVPQLTAQHERKAKLVQTLTFVVGLALMYLVAVVAR